MSCEPEDNNCSGEQRGPDDWAMWCLLGTDSHLYVPEPLRNLAGRIALTVAYAIQEDRKFRSKA